MAKTRRAELLPGTLDVLVLKTLESGPQHGYAIVRRLRETSGEVLLVEEGSLYPALHRMEGRGWIRSRWGVSESNRRAKYYELTKKGRASLAAQVAAWERMQEAIARVLGVSPGGAVG